MKNRKRTSLNYSIISLTMENFIFVSEQPCIKLIVAVFMVRVMEDIVKVS